MTTTLRRSVVALSAAFATAHAVPASAHEVDCSKLAAIALRDPGGSGPLLDPTGLPSLARPSAATLTVNDYPALVAFDVRIRNLASEPSVLSSVVDALPTDATRILSFGDALAGTIPVGGTLHRVYTVAVSSQQDCLAQFPDDAAPALSCPFSRDTALLVTTDSNLASCRARVVCDPQAPQPPPQPPPKPAVCTAPSWSGNLPLPMVGIDFAFGDTVGCDGVTWAAGSFADPFNPSPDFGAVFRVDPVGQLTMFRLDDTGYAVRVDGDGFLDVAGHRRVGTSTATAAAVRQFDPVGTLRWEFELPGFVAGDAGVDADVDASSNVYAAYRSTAPGGISVVKLAPDGTLVWSTSLGPTAGATLGHVAAAPGGGVFVAGSTAGSFPGQTGAGGLDAFLARLDADGNVAWIRQLGGAGQDSGAAVAVDPGGSGRVVLAGSTQGPLDGGAPVSVGSDAFLAVFDGTGSLQWVRELRAIPLPSSTTTLPASPGVTAAAIDPSGAVWVGGTVVGGTIPGGTWAGSSADAFVARYDAAGALLWGHQFGDGTANQLTAIAIDPSGAGVAIENARVGLSRRDVHAIRLSPDGT